MESKDRTTTKNRRLIDQLLGVRDFLPFVPKDRRNKADRRNVTAKSLLHGGFHPRRRAVRRASDTGPQYLDWHHPSLLIAVLGILILSGIDAFLTLKLLHLGGEELNPVMRQLIENDLRFFAVAKMGLTGAGVILFVLHANARLFRVLRVDRLLYLFFFLYLGLIAYELKLLGYF
ncbi:MAG: DUF5658 family protein [Gammaproteobacteria bacterium]